MADTELVTLTNGETNENGELQTFDCPPESVEFWQSRGYRELTAAEAEPDDESLHREPHTEDDREPVDDTDEEG